MRVGTTEEWPNAIQVISFAIESDIWTTDLFALLGHDLIDRFLVSEGHTGVLHRRTSIST